MARTTGHKTVSALLNAGYDLLAEQGLGKLTLDAVVGRTNVTKGALLHHFRTKNDLARRLLNETVADFETLIEQLRGADRSPGSYTRAYVKAAAEPLRDPTRRRLFLAMAELSRDPDLKVTFQQAMKRWAENVQNDGLDRVSAHIARLAADGLWLNETAGAPAMDVDLYTQVTTRMLEMAGAPSDLAPPEAYAGSVPQ